MLHHKAPHRPWQPDPGARRAFKDAWIPEPATLWDAYATRTDALHENQQRIADDLTRRDLKLTPPATSPAPSSPPGWRAKPDRVTIGSGGGRA